MKLAQHKQQFLVYLKKDLGRSPKTIENYHRYVEAFLRFANTDDAHKITQTTLSAFKAHLATQPLSAKSQDYYLIALRSFLKYLKLQGGTVVEPRGIQLINQTTAPVPIVAAKEIARFRKTMAKATTPIALRDRAVIELLLATGMRVSELCALSLDDVSFKKSCCVVTGPRGRARVLPLTAPVVDILKAYLRARRDSDTALFVQFGKNAHNAKTLRLSPRAVQRLLRQRCVTAGVTISITPKSIRQYVATELHRSGEPVSVVQERLGHEHEASTVAMTTPVRPESVPRKRRKPGRRDI